MHLRSCGALVATLLLSRSAGAVPYEVFIDVRTEEDLFDLLATQQISERSFETLLLLLQTQVDLNGAGREELYLLPNLRYRDVDRILAYRKSAGPIQALEDLVTANVLTDRLALSIAPFVLVRPRDADEARASGFVRARATWSGRFDRLPPAAAIQARVRALSLDSGLVLALTRNSLRRVRWDRTRNGLSVEPESTRLVLPKAYVEWETRSWELVAGTYRIGFGQRLTFDVTDRVTPNGAFGDYELRPASDLTLRCKRSAGELERSPCPTQPVMRVTPDFAWTHRLTGVAAGLRRADAGPGWLQAYVWGSVQPHRVQSRDIAVLSACRDPRADDDPSCDAPRVYVRGSSDRAQSTATYASLPLAAVEPLAGLSLGYFWSTRRSVMLTGYGATTRWLVRGVALDYQEIARKPFGGPFGALGLGASFGSGRHDIFVEVTRSFDRQRGGGGGTAAIVRSVTDLGRGELEVSFRSYGRRFANPYARPVSAPDQLDGLRARDELGARVRLLQQVQSRVAVRVLVDAWRRFTAGPLHALAYARLDAELGKVGSTSLWVEHRSSGKRTLLAARLAFDALSELRLSLQLQHRWHAAVEGRGQRDVAGVFTIAGKPAERLGVRVRVRYDLEDAFDNHRLPQTLWLYAELQLQTRARDTLRLRYDLRAFLDERQSTAVRLPNPEHWLWLEYVFRY